MRSSGPLLAMMMVVWAGPACAQTAEAALKSAKERLTAIPERRCTPFDVNDPTALVICPERDDTARFTRERDADPYASTRLQGLTPEEVDKVLSGGRLNELGDPEARKQFDMLDRHQRAYGSLENPGQAGFNLLGAGLMGLNALSKAVRGEDQRQPTSLRRLDPREPLVDLSTLPLPAAGSAAAEAGALTKP
jgi:hypothetical protein